MTDLIDERGHTREQAKAQHPTLNLDAKPASEETPKGNELVPAQSSEEVEAQILNRAGSPDDTHDLTEQLVNAARAEPADEEDGASPSEAAKIAEANEEILGDEDGDDEDDEDGDEPILRGAALDERGRELGIAGFSSMSADDKRAAIAEAEASDES
jgi:hypothetical protein